MSTNELNGKRIKRTASTAKKANICIILKKMYNQARMHYYKKCANT